MICDLDTFEIEYANQRSMELLESIRDDLPVDPEDIIGTAIDVFHKHPQHQHQLLSDPKNYPHKARIKVGEHSLELDVSLIELRNGKPRRASLVWNVITHAVRMAATVSNLSDSVAGTSEELTGSSQSFFDIASEVSDLASAVSTATEELNRSISGVSVRVADASRAADNSVELIRSADNRVAALAQSADSIGKIIEVIHGIAEQTNLLALNATIEAARAGEAGRGFSVVASEVKALASRTKQSIDEVKTLIESIQAATGETVDAMQKIGKTVESVQDISGQVAISVEEQNQAISGIVRNIDGVSNSSRTMLGSAERMRERATDLSSRSVELRQSIEVFLTS
ncbi:MAG: methyl-accepting chemotaxis protein [Geminicoccaceae bacterium]